MALTTSEPLLLIEPAKTKSAIVISSGVDSPVRKELLTVLKPEITTPSVAIFSPGLTVKISPTSISEISIISVFESRTTSTLPADNSNKAAKADPAFRFARCSRYLPSMTKKITVAETSA